MRKVQGTLEPAAAELCIVQGLKKGFPKELTSKAKPEEGKESGQIRE